MSTNNSIIPSFDDKYDESLKIKLESVADIDKCLVLHLSGYVDTYNTALFQERVNLAIEAGYIRLIFNCIKLNYFSSSGIGSFTAFLKAVRQESGDIVIFGMQPKLMDIFQLLGFSQFFAIKRTQEEALEYFGTNGTTEPAAVFPKIIQCPKCANRLRAVKAGRFRCARCAAILVIDDQGGVTR